MVTAIIGTQSGHDPAVRGGRLGRSGDGHQGGPLCGRAAEDRGDRRLRVGPDRSRRRYACEAAQAARGPLQEGQRSADARAARGDAGEGRRSESGRSDSGHHVRERRARRRHRHEPRQGVSGRREAPPLRRRRRDPRVDVSPRARLDRRLVVSVARRQGHARGRAAWAATALPCAT